MATTTTGAAARERILSTAYTLFCRHGIRATGVDTIIERAGVAKMTLYRHFKSKDDLVLAVLDRREEQWTKQWLQIEVRKPTTDPGIVSTWITPRCSAALRAVNRRVRLQTSASSRLHLCC